ncbi:MAG: hypothetical protein EBR23_04750, partial [Planctomycetia bacterium]|nr:hypothetical protein [Planctomycetia bacterium]
MSSIVFGREAVVTPAILAAGGKPAPGRGPRTRSDISIGCPPQHGKPCRGYGRFATGACCGIGKRDTITQVGGRPVQPAWEPAVNARPSQRPLHRPLRSVALLIGICAASVSALAAPPEQLGPTDIQRSIDRARDYLLKQQKPDGTWEAMRSSNKSAGATALVMLALANSGVPATEPPMQRALAWMRTQQPDETYSVALQTMILAMLAPETDRAILERNVEWLERAQVKQGPATGSWSYKQNEGRGIGDNSNSQFALLGLHEAARAGVPVSQDTWIRGQQYWVSCVNPDGSWGYTIGHAAGSGSMTCAGIASVWITSEHVGTPDARAARDVVSCCGGGASPKVLEKGLDWLGRRFTVAQNPGT